MGTHSKRPDESKKEVRRKFRQGVLKRDNYKCRCCGKLGYDRQAAPESLKVPLDAHHIEERTSENYVLENGISVCDDCHWKAEQFHISSGVSWVSNFHPNDLYKLIGSSWRI
jgi:predicted restriction endonuclease